MTGSRPIALLLALTGALALLAAQASGEARAATTAPVGPLAFGQSYVGTLETQSDRHLYFFYVTSAAPAQVVLTVENLGGGEEFSSVSVTIKDASSTPIGGYAYSVGRGESGAAVATVGPQKYFVEVAPHESFGDRYRLTASGGEGAFGPYALIAARCSRATAAAAKASNRLSHRRAKLLRATARLRRSRFDTRRARRRAEAGYRRAKSRVAAERRRLKAARRARSPWCAIPQ